jgi:hypothetical protein
VGVGTPAHIGQQLRHVHRRRKLDGHLGGGEGRGR